jgi:hypothetical protein
VLEDSYARVSRDRSRALIGGLAGFSGGPLGALMGAVGGALIGVSAELPKMVKVQSWLPGFRKNWRLAVQLSSQVSPRKV